LHLTPLAKEIPDLLHDRLLAGGNFEEENHLRTGIGEQFPGARRRGCFLAAEFSSQLFCVVFQVAPSFDQSFARDQLAKIRYFFVVEPRGKEVEHRRRRIGTVAKVVHLLPCFHQLTEAGGIDLGSRPVRT